MTQEEKQKILDWRKRHWVRWKWTKFLDFLYYRVLGLIYKHKMMFLRSEQHYYKYPEDFLFKYTDFLADDGLHIKYFPRWFGQCKRGFLIP